MVKKIKYKKLIEGENCSVVSKIVKDDLSEIDLFISELGVNFESSAIALFEMMKDHAKNGYELMTTLNCHMAHSRKGINIFEYRKGRLRIYWFVDQQSKNIVICSHGAIKRTQNTAKEDKDKAIRAYKYYHENRNNIVIIKENWHEDLQPIYQ